MQHWIINTQTGKETEVKSHSDFYFSILSSICSSEQNLVKFKTELAKIGIKNQPDLDKIKSLLLQPKAVITEELEIFIEDNFPIMKASIYSSNRDVAFTYFKGVPTYKALEAVYEFCSKRYLVNIRIYHGNKGVDVIWDEFRHDDSVARRRLGSVNTAMESKIASKILERR